jgi:hypothetical protein
MFECDLWGDQNALKIKIISFLFPIYLINNIRVGVKLILSLLESEESYINTHNNNKNKECKLELGEWERTKYP